MKKLTQSIIFILVIAALVIGLIACAQKNNEYTALTAKEFANLLLEEGGFTASLSEVDSSLMQQLYALDPDLFDEKVIFASTGKAPRRSSSHVKIPPPGSRQGGSGYTCEPDCHPR